MDSTEMQNLKTFKMYLFSENLSSFNEFTDINLIQFSQC